MTARRCVVALLTNPVAGSGRGRRAGAAARDELGRLGVDVVDVGCPTPQAALRRTREVAADVDAVVVVGGDGSVHLAAQACAGTRVPLGVVPAGSGNDIARTCGLVRGDPREAVRRAVAALSVGRARPLDLLRVHGEDGAPPHWAAGAFSGGLDALVNERANTWRRLPGGSRYLLAVVRELPALRPISYDLVVDGVAEHRRALLVTVANGAFFGGGMRIAPGASVDDGLLDLVVVDPLPPREFARVLPSVFSGGHVRHPAVSVRRVRAVRVAADRDVLAHADGESVGPLPRAVEVAAGALRLLA